MDNKSDKILAQLTAIRSTLERVDKRIKKLSETPPQKNFDELFVEAKKIASQTSRICPSLLQRKLQIGYARAARLIDMLEDEGIIGPPNGAKPRKAIKST